MPRKTPVRELQKEEPVPSSPLRRSSRISNSSPVPTKVITRRNSATEATTSAPKVTRGRRSSFSQELESNTDSQPDKRKSISAVKTRRGSLSSNNEDIAEEAAQKPKTRGSSVSKEEPTPEVKRTTRHRQSLTENSEDDVTKKVTRSRSGSIGKKIDENTKTPNKKSLAVVKDISASTPVKKSAPAEKLDKSLESTEETNKATDSPDAEVSENITKRRTDVSKIDFDLSVINEASMTEEDVTPQKKPKDTEDVKKDLSELSTDSKIEPEAKIKEPEVLNTKVNTSLSKEVTSITASVREDVSEKIDTAEKLEDNLHAKENASMEVADIEQIDSSPDCSFNLQLSSSVLENSNKNESDVKDISNKENVCPKVTSTVQESEVEPMDVDNSVEILSPIKSKTMKSPKVSSAKKVSTVEQTVHVAEKITEEIDQFLQEKIITCPIENSNEKKRVNGPKETLTAANTEETELSKSIAGEEKVNSPLKKVIRTATPTKETADLAKKDLETIEEHHNEFVAEETVDLPKKNLETSEQHNGVAAEDVKVETHVEATEDTMIKETNAKTDLEHKISVVEKKVDDEDVDNNIDSERAKSSKETAQSPKSDESVPVTQEEIQVSEEIRIDVEEDKVTQMSSPKKNSTEEKSLDNTSQIEVPEGKNTSLEKEDASSMQTEISPQKEKITNEESPMIEKTPTLDISISSEGQEKLLESAENQLSQMKKNCDVQNEINIDKSITETNKTDVCDSESTSFVDLSKDSEEDSIPEEDIDKSSENVESVEVTQSKADVVDVDNTIADGVDVENAEKSTEEKIDTEVEDNLMKNDSNEELAASDQSDACYKSPVKKRRTYHSVSDDEIITKDNPKKKAAVDQLDRSIDSKYFIPIRAKTSQEVVEVSDSEGDAEEIEDNEKVFNQSESDNNKENDSLNKSKGKSLEKEAENSTFSNSFRRRSVDRKSITLQETVKAGEDSDLSDRIHTVVDLFCSGIKNDAGVSVNVSLEYTGQNSDSEDENAHKTALVEISLNAIEKSGPESVKGSKRRKICTDDLDSEPDRNKKRRSSVCADVFERTEESPSKKISPVKEMINSTAIESTIVDLESDEDEEVSVDAEQSDSEEQDDESYISEDSRYASKLLHASYESDPNDTTWKVDEVKYSLTDSFDSNLDEDVFLEEESLIVDEKKNEKTEKSPRSSTSEVAISKKEKQKRKKEAANSPSSSTAEAAISKKGKQKRKNEETNKSSSGSTEVSIGKKGKQKRKNEETEKSPSGSAPEVPIKKKGNQKRKLFRLSRYLPEISSVEEPTEIAEKKQKMTEEWSEQAQKKSNKHKQTSFSEFKHHKTILPETSEIGKESKQMQGKTGSIFKKMKSQGTSKRKIKDLREKLDGFKPSRGNKTEFSYMKPSTKTTSDWHVTTL